ncbi:Bug family tripartite tricarboxylate transporter substrate binding protein [Roseomonas sp. CCTCC AB2023176]|uniref:Bug family tripartite tricarboxylate transporter substrate binding protein n=1 Tax=Roseomonas sp. CCTCC AB2023176 TaxID=3342640 RepID=UPI0035DEEE48
MHADRAAKPAGRPLLATPAIAQPRWPSRPVRIIVPFAAGGPTEVPARFIAEHLTHRLGQPFIVEPRPGAGGALGVQAAVAANDGHTLLFTTSSIAILPSLMQNPGYDPFRDVVPVTLATDAPLALLVRPDHHLRDLADLVTKSRDRPEALSYGSSGNGSTTHLAGELLRARANIPLLHVPYRGMAPATNALYAGDTDTLVVGMVEAMPHLRDGRLRALCVTTPRRIPQLPDVPAVAEAAPGFGITIWYALFAPRGTPEEVVARLAEEVAPLAHGTPLARRMEESGVALLLDGPAPLADRLRREVPLFRDLITTSNIRPD